MISRSTGYAIRAGALAGALLALTGSATAGEPAQVRVTTDPPGAVITCDGVVYSAAPVTLTDLAPGRHLVVAGKPGFVETRRSITLAAGQRMALDLKLEPVMGLVLVHSTPPGVDVQVDGADRGRTRPEGHRLE